MSKMPVPTEAPRERAFLVGVELEGEARLLGIDDSLREMELLARTAGLRVVGQATQRLDRPDSKTYIRSGKVEEVHDLAEDALADLILFDAELSPRHQRELENAFGNKLRVIDRTALILDIFALHANTREGALQVELAQYEYRLPRLTRAWTHLARQAGGRAGSVGGVGLRGPGETQLEVDRREIGRKIANLRIELDKVRAHRGRHRMQRKRSRIPTVALVGYTNAGKSTLLNRLADADVYVADQLFATLDPTTRRVDLPGGQQVLFTDTVGFIQKLPTTLVAAFRATLEEITEADLLLHVVDVTHSNALAQAEAVEQTLESIGVVDLPMITALNKIDLLLENDPLLGERRAAFPGGVAVSAFTGEGVDDLLAMVSHELFESMSPLEALLPYREGALISTFHEHGVIERSEHREQGVLLSGRLPNRFLVQFKQFRVHSEGGLPPED